MAVPKVSLTIRDPGLGLAPADISGIQAKIGVCSKGTPNTVYSFGTRDALVEELGAGPLVEDAAIALDAGGPVICVPASTTPQQPSAVTATRTSSSTGTVSVSGTSNIDVDVVIVITKTGDIGAGEFKVSLDGGATFGDDTLLAASYPLGDTGLTLTFTKGGGPTYFEEGDEFSFTAKAPYMTSQDLSDALDALLDGQREFSFLHVIGGMSAATAAVVSSALEQAFEDGRYLRAIVEAFDVGEGVDESGDPVSPSETVSEWENRLLAMWADFADKRVMVCAGAAKVQSAVSAAQTRKNIACLVAARASAVGVSRDLGAVADGPLTRAVELYYDARVRPSLHNARFTTMRTHVGMSGFYITNGLLMAPTGSDFRLWQYGRVMDVACRTMVRTLALFLNDNVRVNDTDAEGEPGQDGAPGTIDEGDARAIETEVESALHAALVAPGHVTRASFRVNRSDNIISTRKLRGDGRIVPLGYLQEIDVEIGYENPAISAVAA